MLVNARRLSALVCVLPLLLAAACGPAQPSPEPGTSDAAPLNIVAAFYPFQFIAERVAGEHANVTSLTEPGAEPHDVELKPSQVASLTEANLVVYEKSFHAADYTERAAALTQDLTRLDQSFATGLKSCEREDFITTHAAFGYLASRYHLNQIGISGLSPDAEPSPSRIAEIQDIALEYEITTIFSETLVSPAVAESIAGDLDLRTDVLDPIEGITPESRGQDYLAVMAANLAALKQANGCS